MSDVDDLPTQSVRALHLRRLPGAHRRRVTSTCPRIATTSGEIDASPFLPPAALTRNTTPRSPVPPRLLLAPLPPLLGHAAQMPIKLQRTHLEVVICLGAFVEPCRGTLSQEYVVVDMLRDEVEPSLGAQHSSRQGCTVMLPVGGGVFGRCVLLSTHNKRRHPSDNRSHLRGF